MTSTEHLPFTKYTALGNDYLVFDGGHFGTTLDVQQIVRLCDRRFGVGADGIRPLPVPGERAVPSAHLQF